MSYKLSEVAAAVGISSATLATWCDRGMIPMPKTGKGTNRTFSIKDVDRAAIINELVRLSLPVAEASRAASIFSDERSTGRPRGQLYREGKTLLIVDRDGTSVVNVHDRDEFEDAMSKLFSDERGVIVLSLSTLLARVDARLEGGATHNQPAGTLFRNGKQLRVA